MKQLFNSISLNRFQLKHINEQLSSINFNSSVRKNFAPGLIGLVLVVFGLSEKNIISEQTFDFSES